MAAPSWRADGREPCTTGISAAGRDKVVDLVLADETDRRLLVRVLAAGSNASEAKLTQTGAKLDTYTHTRRGRQYSHRRLVLPTRGVRGHYVVMLYPLRKGQAPPATAWKGKSLTVTLGNQRDVFDFAVGKDGRTRVTISQNGKPIARVK